MALGECLARPALCLQALEEGRERVAISFLLVGRVCQYDAFPRDSPPLPVSGYQRPCCLSVTRTEPGRTD